MWKFIFTRLAPEPTSLALATCASCAQTIRLSATKRLSRGLICPLCRLKDLRSAVIISHVRRHDRVNLSISSWRNCATRRLSELLELEPGVGVEPTFCGSAGHRLNRSAFGGHFARDRPRRLPRRSKVRFSPYKSIERRSGTSALISCHERHHLFVCSLAHIRQRSFR